MKALLRRLFPDGVGSSSWTGYLCTQSCMDKHACGVDRTVEHWQHICVECGFRWAA